MFDKFQGDRVGRRCCVTVIANLDKLAVRDGPVLFSF